MTIKKLREILSYWEDDDIVVVDGMKIVNKDMLGVTSETYVNSAGGTWEGGCGTAPDGTFCGECSTFNCEQCSWKEGK